MNSEITIVGGGIGGLALALAAQRRRIKATVYEASDSVAPVGAGIWLPTNAMSVLERLGVAAAIEARGVPLSRIEIHDADDGLLQSVDLDPIASRYGFTTVAIRRADLHAVLLEALAPGTVQLGRRCASVEQGESFATVRFEDGEEVRAGLVVGADGINSKVRAAVDARVALRYAGQTTWRGIAKLSAPQIPVDLSREIWGGRNRFGYSAVARDEIYWFAPMVAPAGGRDENSAVRENLSKAYADFPAPVVDILQATSHDSILRTDLYELRSPSRWWRGRVVLLGDAAHAATPNLGQGGAQALEDAWVLAECLARYENIEHAFADYEHRRQPRAHLVTSRSRYSGQLAHVTHPTLRRVRNAVLRAMPDAVTQRHFASLSVPA
ncbi:MAG: 2-polyprenyl-6-methoxyphenol hydroxylase-like FAD-dependent oxidoreductase [Hyphomicrobiaceae bacterium]